MIMGIFKKNTDIFFFEIFDVEYCWHCFTVLLIEKKTWALPIDSNTCFLFCNGLDSFMH